VGIDSILNNTFKDFRYEVEVRNRAVTGEIFGGERIFLEKRFYDGMFE